jgi:transposase InsO family protein
VGTLTQVNRGLVIERVNQMWAADIGYIPMANGFLYLVAVMDWVSRYVLAWRLSNLLDSSFCVEALEDTLSQGRPEIFNTDQGSQFTGDDFIDVSGWVAATVGSIPQSFALKSARLMLPSCDGQFASTKGSGAIRKRSGTGCVRSSGATPTCSLTGTVSHLRPDHGSWMNREVHVQFWEGVGLRCRALLAYLKAYQSVAEARCSIASYFEFYNHQRLHQALGYRAPRQVFEEALRLARLRLGRKTTGANGELAAQ